jgi:hypothetical protein
MSCIKKYWALNDKWIPLQKKNTCQFLIIFHSIAYNNILSRSNQIINDIACMTTSLVEFCEHSQFSHSNTQYKWYQYTVQMIVQGIPYDFNMDFTWIYCRSIVGIPPSIAIPYIIYIEISHNYTEKVIWCGTLNIVHLPIYYAISYEILMWNDVHHHLPHH